MTNFYNFLEMIQQRPGMYLGDLKITTLDHFLGGYRFALSEKKVTQENPNFSDFSDWVARYYALYEGTAGWARIILENSYNEEAALNKFFELISIYKEDRLVGLFNTKPAWYTDKCTFQSKGKVYRKLKKVAISRYQKVELFYMTYCWPHKQETKTMFRALDECFKHGENFLDIKKTEWLKI